jgi:hypothetical protein
MAAKIKGAAIGEDANSTSLTLKNLATADDSVFTLNLQTAEADIAANDVIGKIAFAAPNEGTGTAANLTAAAVQAVSEGDFSSSINASSLVFMTGYNSAATEVARFTSNGSLLINTTNDGPASSVGGGGAYKKSLIIQDDVVGGTIYLGSNGSGDNSMLGGVHFFNSNNADEDASDADGQLVAFIRSRSETSDNNAGDDSGAFLQFANSAESSSLTETFRIAGNGDLTGTDTSISSNSDSRLKDNVQDYTYDISKFKQFQAKTFDWKNKDEHNGRTGNRGFLAQEVAAIDDYWTDQISLEKDSEDAKLIPANSDGNHMAYTLKLGKKDAMYISVIQQLITRIEALEDA